MPKQTKKDFKKKDNTKPSKNDSNKHSFTEKMMKKITGFTKAIVKFLTEKTPVYINGWNKFKIN